MNVAYGIRRLDGELVVVGAVRHSKPNSVKLSLNDRQRDELHSFILLAPASLSRWQEVQIPDLTDVETETKLWANPLNKRLEHRPQTFKGYPIRANMVVLMPTIDLSKYEPSHDGFIESYQASKPKRRARSLDDL